MHQKALNYNISIPEKVNYVLETLISNGFEAYIVGGCVRDILLGLTPADWDITTNAEPEETISCFKDVTVVPTGLKHGTVTIIINSYPIEVTTYRIDGDYKDHRRPDNVLFTKNLREDLARRDFTVNAMAYNSDSGIIDYFGGLDDLGKKTIRCVGDPEKRFAEDALRIFRCVRLASQLDFIIEEKTELSMKNLSKTLDFVAKERLQSELSLAVMGKGFKRVFLENPEPLFQIIPELKPSYKFDQNTPYHIYDIYEHILTAVKAAACNPIIKLTMLFHDIGKPDCYTVDENGVGHFKGHGRVSVELTNRILRRLKYSNDSRERILVLVKYHDLKIPPTNKVIRRWLNRLGKQAFEDLMLVQRADAAAKTPKFGKIQISEIEEIEKMFKIVLEENQCFSLEHLNISGKDITSLGVSEGPKIGKILNCLLEKVVDGDIPNEKEVLIEETKNLLSFEH